MSRFSSTQPDSLGSGTYPTQSGTLRQDETRYDQLAHRYDNEREKDLALKSKVEQTYHLLTFVTKYSRLPDEEIENKRYNAVMENGKESVKLNPRGYAILIDAFDKQAQNLGIHILACNILIDHVHIIITNPGKDISEIIGKLKGYSSFMYNKTFGENNIGNEEKNPLRARGYSNTILDNKTHFENAIKYVQTNHIKHGIVDNLIL